VHLSPIGRIAWGIEALDATGAKRVVAFRSPKTHNLEKVIREMKKNKAGKAHNKVALKDLKVRQEANSGLAIPYPVGPNLFLLPEAHHLGRRVVINGHGKEGCRFLDDGRLRVKAGINQVDFLLLLQLGNELKPPSRIITVNCCRH